MFKLLRKRFFKTTKNKGFTLTELIVVVAIVALLMACVVAFASPIRAAVKGSTAKADCLTINEIVASYIQRKLAYANDIHVFVGHDYKTTGKLYDAVIGSGGGATGFKDYANTTGAENHPGIMVLHYTENKDDPLKHTFKLYDYAIPKGLTSMPAEDKVICDDTLVYLDEFYGGYEFFMTFDGPAGDPGAPINIASVANAQTRRAYFNMHIDSYNIDGDFSTHSFTADDIKDYYTNYTSDGVISSKMDDYRNERVAVDNVSFTLENIKMKVISKEVDTDGDGNPDTLQTIPQLDGLAIDRGNELGGYDTDVVILYNVRIYDIKNDTIA